MDKILVFLLRRNAHISPVVIPTTELGAQLGMSQQNASRLLMKMEAEGKISRSRNGIVITRNGLDEIRQHYISLKQLLEGKKMTISGKILTGLGEGGYYISLEGYLRQFIEKVGFEPFAGTLNLLLDEKNQEKRFLLRELEPIIINGWKTSTRSFGDLFVYKCSIGGVGCAIVIPVRTHHGTEILEIVAPVNIKKKLGKKDGDLLKIELL